MCYDKCVKLNQRQNFKIHLWNLSFNTVIMGIILYWRMFHYSQVKWAVNFTWRWLLLLELNNLQRQEEEEEEEEEPYIRTQNVSFSYQIKYSQLWQVFLVPNCNLSVHQYIATLFAYKHRMAEHKKYNFKDTPYQENIWHEDCVSRGSNAATWPFTHDKCKDKRQRSERFSFIQIDIQM